MRGRSGALVIAAMVTVGCKQSGTANASPVDSGASAVVTVASPPVAKRALKEIPPPLAMKVAEAAQLEAEMMALPGYASLWEAGRRNDLFALLTAVGESLVGEENDPEGRSSLPESVAKAVESAKAMDVLLKAVAVIGRTGALPKDFAARTKDVLSSLAGEPRRGLWSPTKSGTPRDFTAVAVVLNPTDAAALREFISARKGGPFGWEDQAKPVRPYLARERAALERLAEVSSLTSDEADRLATLKKSRWSGEYAVPTPTADLLSTYKDNEVRADARWKGHGVEISATVKTVKKNAMDSIFAVLGTGRGVEAVTAHCEVSDRYVEGRPEPRISERAGKAA